MGGCKLYKLTGAHAARLSQSYYFYTIITGRQHGQTVTILYYKSNPYDKGTKLIFQNWVLIICLCPAVVHRTMCQQFTGNWESGLPFHWNNKRNACFVAYCLFLWIFIGCRRSVTLVKKILSGLISGLLLFLDTSSK